ncbi:RNA recognition domain-containing protein [Apiospora saccharicola]|uniref:RNA recognition domain-containing protein n=1 Tax=Apiospora saccharicola TaxID=335842 RepID=A0ABR1UJ33_9PEZI
MAGSGKKRSRDQSTDSKPAAAAAAASEQAQTAPAEKGAGETATTAETAERATKRPRVEENRTLFVRSLPTSATDESLTEFFSNYFPVKHATVVKDRATKASRGYGFVTFTDAEDAIEARKKLNNQALDGKKITLDVAEARQRKPKATAEPSGVATETASRKEQRVADLAEARKPQNAKLIVRNLPWSIKTPEQLSALFQRHGKVKYADVPQSKGKLAGFGFVTFRRHKHAELAMEGENGTIVDGRPIAVDWAAEKDEWTKQQKGGATEETTPAKKASKKAEADEDDSPEDKEEPEEDEDDGMDEDMRNFMKNQMANMEDEDDENEEDEDEEEEDDADLGVDDDEEEEDEKPAPKRLTTNNDSTIFVRNLPFTVDDEGLKEHFEAFGAVRYARCVMDRATDRPAGTGFVCFYNVDDSASCVRGAPRQQLPDNPGKRSILQNEMADLAGMYTMDGRVLQVTQAVNKNEATRLTETGIAARDTKDRDKRRLYLLPEGSISAGSPLHSLLSASEIQMRDDSAAQRKKQIQGNPSLHLSLTRLALRNIPRSMTPKELKALAREAVVGFSKDVKAGLREPLSKEEINRGGADDKEAERRRKEKKKGIVSQAKIVYENTQGSKVDEKDGAGKSRGYGFIEYSSHRWALMGLRWLNGHQVQNETSKSSRLIAEFAIENAQVVARRKDILLRSTQGPRNPPQQAEVPKNAPFAERRVAFKNAGKNGARRPGWNGQRPAGDNKRPGRDNKGPGRDDKKPGFDGKKPGGGFDGKKPGGKFGDRKKPDRSDAAPKGGAADGEGKKGGGDARQALDQKIIARKRNMRKKKATARSSR